MAKTLVAFYSRKGENYMPGGLQTLEKGHTARAAEYIQKALDADIFEIDTAKPYAAGYRDCCMEAVAEMKAAARPELREYPGDLSEYDRIFVCFPCWCGTAPMCVFTFLEHYDFAGKKIVPLCTNEGSGMANSVADIKASCPGAEVAEGLPFRGHLCEGGAEEIGAWAKENV